MILFNFEYNYQIKINIIIFEWFLKKNKNKKMNFPPIIFHDIRFPSIMVNNHLNQFSSTLISSQNILKKLLKFDTKENNFQSNVINWLKNLNKNQLIKYFTINSQWFVDILRDMLIVTKYHPNAQFMFNPPTANLSYKVPFFNLFNQNDIRDYKPRFTDYFMITELSNNNDDEGVIDLGKKKKKNKNKNSLDENSNIQFKFLDNIRYLTLSLSKSKNGEKFFFDYNNIVTLSYDYLMNVEKLVEIMLNISKNEIFKYPIKFESLMAENGKKYYYNIFKASWLNDKFTLAELLCNYFEQSILLNYEYNILYKQEIPGIYYDKLDEYIDNIFKLVIFIGNSNEKKVEIFKSIHPEEILKIYNDNYFLNYIVNEKKNLADNYNSMYNSSFIHSKSYPKKDIINSTLMNLQNLFIKSDLGFVINMTFMKNSKIFTTEDFVIKIVFEIINNYWKNKAVEDLLQDLESKNNNDNKNNNSNHKKKRKKKKKKNNNNEGNKEIKEEQFENKNENNDNDININNSENNLGEKQLKENLDEKINKNSEINNINNIPNNNIIINALKEDDKNNISNDIKEKVKEDSSNEDIKENEEDNENNKKAKEKEKNFFLYPVVQHKKKRNKNKKKDKKNNINKNNINEINIINSEKSESTKTNSSIKEKENEKVINNSKIINNNTQKHINKFNIGTQYKDNSKEINIDLNNGNNGYFDPDLRESNILRSKKDDKYLLAGSNIPKFTSFYFKSKKKKNFKNRKNNDLSPFSFISNNILEFSQEISENTQKVNKNKEILQQIREKFIKKIYENINIILRNEDVNFLCSFYGSSISGLSIENSDIDIMVKIRKNENEINYLNRIMDLIVHKFKKNPELNYIKNIHPIYTASVPVIKLECDISSDSYLSSEINNLIKLYDLTYNNLTKLFFDITFFEVNNENEKIPSELMIDYIKECTQTYPQIFDIIYIMKKFLFNRKLNQSYQGGLSSFSLFLLILAFIKYFENSYDTPIGSLLIEFLYFYSNFDFYNTVIQPDKNDVNEIFINSTDFINEKNGIYFKYNINIVDPITGLNVAKSTFKIEEIKKAFKDGLDIIYANLYNIKTNNINNNTENNFIKNDGYNHTSYKNILENFFFSMNKPLQ